MLRSLSPRVILVAGNTSTITSLASRQVSSLVLGSSGIFVNLLELLASSIGVKYQSDITLIQIRKLNI